MPPQVPTLIKVSAPQFTSSSSAIAAEGPPMPVEVQRKPKQNKAQKRIKQFDRMVEGEFLFHYDTSQLQKDIQYYNPDDVVDISVKLHGTSSIIAKVHVNQPIKLPFVKSMFNKFIDFTHLFKSFRITDSEVVYGPVYSSRKVIKNRYINNEVTGGYYNCDIWTEYGNIIYPYIDEGMTVYGEIFGYLTGQSKMIQKSYDYGCKEGDNSIMIYRITTTNEDGSKHEWEIPEIYEWTLKLIDRMKECGDENYKHIHPIDILYSGRLGDLYSDLDTEVHWHENLLERMKNDKEHFGMEEPEPLCKAYPESPREGIVLRRRNDTVPRAEKLKTISFALKEAIAYDSNDADIEALEGYSEEA